AGTAALIALAAGASFVYATVRFIRRRLPLLETLSLAPVAVSSVALAYGVSVAFRGPLQFVPQELRIPLVHAVLAFPFVVRAFRPVLEGVDARLVEAARTLGAGRWRAFVDIELPMAMTGLLVAFALSFGLSVSETTATLMLARPDQVTMPVSVYRFLAARDFQSASAMAVLLMAVTGGVFLLAETFSGWLRRRQGGMAGERGSEEDGRPGRPACRRRPAACKRRRPAGAGGGGRQQAVRARRRGGRRPHPGGRRRALGRGRAFGVRQDHALAHRRGPGAGRCGPGGHSRQRRVRPAARAAGRGLWVSAVRAVSQHERGGQRGIRLEAQGGAARRAEAAGGGDAGHGGSGRPGAPAAGPAQRGAAAAGGAGPGAGAAAENAAFGRAAVGAGRRH